MRLQQLLVYGSWLLIFAASQYCKPYCTSSSCAPTFADCNVGCTSPYIFNTTSTVGCSLALPSVLTINQLPSQTTFVSSGFTSNGAPSTYSCVNGANTFFMLGPFGNNKYVYKAFSGLGTNHYQVDVFWSFGIFGGWVNEPLDTIFVNGNGAIQIFSQGQLCGVSTAFTGCSTTPGCFLSYTQSFSHNTDFLSINFSSVGSGLSVAKSWSVNNLIVVLSVCTSPCLTCTGSAVTNCLTCISGLYLQGSSCITVCPILAIPSLGTCVTACPKYYYTNTLNKYCQPCPIDCPYCSSSTQCLDWGGNDPSNLLLDYLPLWIVVAIFLITLLGVIFWKLCCSSKTFQDKMQEQVIDHKPKEYRREINNSYQTMQAKWMEEIDDLHISKVHAKKGKGIGIQGIGQQLNNV